MVTKCCMGAILTKMHGYTILHKDDLNESCNFKDKELIMHGYKYFYGGDLNRICICKERTILISSFVIEWLTYIFKKCLGGLKIFVGASGRKKLPAMAMPAQTPAGRRCSWGRTFPPTFSASILRQYFRRTFFGGGACVPRNPILSTQRMPLGRDLEFIYTHFRGRPRGD